MASQKIQCEIEIPEAEFLVGEKVVLHYRDHPCHKQVGGIMKRYCVTTNHIYESGKTWTAGSHWVYLVTFGPWGQHDCAEDRLERVEDASQSRRY